MDETQEHHAFAENWTLDIEKNRFCSSINSQREFETHPKTAAFDDSNLLCFASNIFQHCNSATEKGVLMRTRGEDELYCRCLPRNQNFSALSIVNR